MRGLSYYDPEPDDEEYGSPPDLLTHGMDGKPLAAPADPHQFVFDDEDTKVDFYGESRSAAYPIVHPPKSWLAIEQMRLRYERGESIFDPRDAKLGERQALQTGSSRSRPETAVGVIRIGDAGAASAEVVLPFAEAKRGRRPSELNPSPEQRRRDVLRKRAARREKHVLRVMAREGVGRESAEAIVAAVVSTHRYGVARPLDTLWPRDERTGQLWLWGDVLADFREARTKKTRRRAA